MIGFAAIFLALLLSGAAAFSYFSSHLRQMTGHSGNAKFGQTGYRLYKASVVLISGAAIYLFYLLLTDQFQYAYVFGYSEKELSLVYKISAFWAGQEGSFLLWLVFHALFGLIIGRRVGVKQTAAVMAVYCLIQVVLLTILISKSPFVMLPEVRTNGSGLNPLLMDPWMVIHPPIIFLGYALLAIPFAYSIGGLLTGRHTEWIEDALPWSLFAWCALGAGIFVGGFWAYKVLGWGGYWAWDPVENASLVPWLVCSVMIHLFLISKVRPGVIRLTYLITIFTFVMVLYGTFLTRSGVLSNFSTHSFADEGYGSLLAVLVALVLVSSLILLIIKWPKIPEGDLFQKLMSREFITLAGLFVICILAAVITVGMSTPLLTMLLGNTQNVHTSFYNETSLPLLAFLLACLFLAPLVKWRQSSHHFEKTGIGVLIAGAGAVAVAALSGIPGVLTKIVIGLAVAAGLANLLGMRQGIQKEEAVAHIGVAVLAVGIIVSAMASDSKTVTMDIGKPINVFDRSLIYQGQEALEAEKVSYQKFAVGESDQTVIRSLSRFSKDGRMAAREPAIYRTFGADYYITPVVNEEKQQGNEVTLLKGKTEQSGQLTLSFDNYGMNSNDAQKLRVYARVLVKDEHGSELISPELVRVNGHFESVPVKALGHYEVALTALSTTEGKIKLEVRDINTQSEIESVNLEISYKPLISLVWLGCILISAGILWAGLIRPSVGKNSKSSKSSTANSGVA